MLHSDGDVAVVTGAAGLIGKEYCRALTRSGYRVAALDINGAALAEISEDVALTCACDVTAEEPLQEAVDKIVTELGGIDVVVTNAGGPGMTRTAAQDLALADWNRVVSLNLTSAWLTARHCFPHLAERARGRVINVASVSAYVARPDQMAAYIAAKAGIVGLTRALAREWGPFGITVNAVAPGVVVGGGARHIHSEEQYNVLLDTARREQAVAGSLQPSDVSGVINFLASPEADMITGQVISVDGGWAYH